MTLRRTPMAPRKAPLARVPMPRKRPRKTGPAKTVADVVRARDGGCVVAIACDGRPGLTVINHRVNRGMGGSSDPAVNQPASLIETCNADNLWLEDNPLKAEANGWKVKRPTEPATVPVTYPDGTRWLLDDDGGRRPA